MRHKFLIAMLLAYAAVLLTGCAGHGEREVLACIDKKQTITLSEFNDRISKLPQRYQDVINKNKKEFLDELIIDILLYNEAVERNLEKDKDVKAVMEEAKKKILIARLLKNEVEDKITVNAEEIEDYYRANKGQFTMPTVLRASHILVKTQSEAREILAELSKGRNFEDMAKARSLDPTAKIGGDIGYFSRNQLVPEIEEICFDMEVGEVSDIVKTRFGYHIVKLTERKEAGVKELDEVRDSIEQIITRIKKKKFFNEFVAGLKERSQITINNKLLETISEEIREENLEE